MLNITSALTIMQIQASILDVPKRTHALISPAAEGKGNTYFTELSRANWGLWIGSRDRVFLPRISASNVQKLMTWSHPLSHLPWLHWNDYRPERTFLKDKMMFASQPLFLRGQYRAEEADMGYGKGDSLQDRHFRATVTWCSRYFSVLWSCCSGVNSDFKYQVTLTKHTVGVLLNQRRQTALAR